MNMKVNLAFDFNAEKIAALTEQLPPQEFSRTKALIDRQARLRFKGAVREARREFRHSGLKRKDMETILAEVRGKAR